MLRALPRVVGLGHRVLVGTSRKRFLAEALSTDGTGDDPTVTEARRDLATAVTSVLAAQAGAWAVRVHDVIATRDASRVAGEWQGGRPMDFVDEITLTGLRVFGRHGVFEDERRVGQHFVVDATLYVSTAAAAASDDVADTVHYGEVAERIAAIVGGEPGQPARDARPADRRRPPRLRRGADGRRHRPQARRARSTWSSPTCRSRSAAARPDAMGRRGS